MPGAYHQADFKAFFLHFLKCFSNFFQAFKRSIKFPPVNIEHCLSNLLCF